MDIQAPEISFGAADCYSWSGAGFRFKAVDAGLKHVSPTERFMTAGISGRWSRKP